eukprot:gene50166-61391_t
MYIPTPGTREVVLAAPLFKHVRIARAAAGPRDYGFASCATPHTGNFNFNLKSDQPAHLDLLSLGGARDQPGRAHINKWVLYGERAGRGGVEEVEVITDARVDYKHLLRAGALRFVGDGETAGDVEVAALHYLNTSEVVRRAPAHGKDEKGPGDTKELERKIAEQQELIDSLQKE